MSRPALYTTRHAVENVVVISVFGELNGSTQEELWRAVDREIDDGRLNVVIDASGLSYVSSRGFAALIRIVQRVRKRFGDVRLAALNQTVGPMFRLLRFDRLLRMYDTVDKAVSSFQRDVWM